MKPSSESLESNAGGTPAWHVTVLADHGPLVLARVLQKFAVPEIKLIAAHYTVEETDGATEVRLVIRAHSHRARLAASRLGSVLHVRSVKLAEAASQPAAVAGLPDGQ